MTPQMYDAERATELCSALTKSIGPRNWWYGPSELDLEVPSSGAGWNGALSTSEPREQTSNGNYGSHVLGEPSKKITRNSE